MGKGGIYFIGNESHRVCKIGYTTDLQKRYYQINTSCPIELGIFFFLEADRKTEKMLHTVFSRQRYKGEWFLLDKEMLNFITIHQKGEAKTIIDREGVSKDLSVFYNPSTKEMFYDYKVHFDSSRELYLGTFENSQVRSMPENPLEILKLRMFYEID